ncbi:MAG TPA: response regulator [Sphingomicrobium sp.]|jgi:DNA-binding response OmpR family regulator|nr:response regulator [Sphingomicrobium sp.]
MDGTTDTEATSIRAPRVLIVEPNRGYCSVLARRISEGGYRVATATGAQAAIAELNRIDIDLVLSELRMPGTGGAELAAMIREDAVHRHVPVMLITGRSEPSTPVRAYQAGADDVILKPFHFEVLIARIGRRIDSARAIQALRDDNATLDARIVTRAIELGEVRDRLRVSEAERQRLAAMIKPAA